MSYGRNHRSSGLLLLTPWSRSSGAPLWCRHRASIANATRA